MFRRFRDRSSPVFAVTLALLAAVLVLVMPSTAGAAGGSLPSWYSGDCVLDGDAVASSDACVPPGESPTDPTSVAPAHCAGAVLCDASWSELKAAGVDAARMRREFEAEAEAEVGLSMGSRRGRGRSPGFTGYFAANDFYLASAGSGVCRGTVTMNQHCAWLYNHWQLFVDGNPKPSAASTVFPARSGNNDPTDHWVQNVGPLPNADWGSADPSLNHFHWGWRGGSYDGYTATSDPSFDPGLWPLDPWVVWRGDGRSGVQRCCFEIHGGSGSHEFWQAPTAGCIRLEQASIRSLRSLWANYTDNKRMSPGPNNGVHYRAP